MPSLQCVHWPGNLTATLHFSSYRNSHARQDTTRIIHFYTSSISKHRRTLCSWQIPRQPGSMQTPQFVDIPAAGESQMSLDTVRGQSRAVPTHTREGSSTQMLTHDGIIELLKKAFERWRLVLDTRRIKYGSIADEFPRGFTPEESRLQWNRKYKALEEEAQALRDGTSTTSSEGTRCSDATGTTHSYVQRGTSGSPSTSYRSSPSPASQTPPNCNLSNLVEPILGIVDSYENAYCAPSETRSQEHGPSRRKRSYDTMIEDLDLFPVCKRFLNTDSRQAHDPQGALHVETPPRAVHSSQTLSTYDSTVTSPSSSAPSPFSLYDANQKLPNTFFCPPPPGRAIESDRRVVDFILPGRFINKRPALSRSDEAIGRQELGCDLGSFNDDKTGRRLSRRLQQR